MQFSQKLQQLRTERAYSEEQLARLLNVSRQAVIKWEKGSATPDINQLKSLAGLFDVTVDSLLEDIEDTEEANSYFCWKLCLAGGVIGLVLGWLLGDMAGANMGAFGIGGAIIGFVLGYAILEIHKKLS